MLSRKLFDAQSFSQQLLQDVQPFLPPENLRDRTPDRSLHAFMRAAWHVPEPATPFVDGFHARAICEHLEACTHGEIRNLVINIPPRCAKSLLVSVFWPCWVWTFRPSVRWLFSSYSQVLSIRDSVKCRRLILSPWFQREYGRVFQLAGDANLKTRFDNNKTGYRIATSVGGSGTGEGGDVVVVDDPHNVTAGESDAIRESTVEWWRETMSTRGNDPKTVVRVVVMQRVHERDLTGQLLASELGYDHLCLPMRYEDTEAARSRITSIGFQDPRKTEGDLLWPERFGAAEVDQLEKNLGSYATAAQHQQRPTPRGGGMFKRAWFPIVGALPVGCRFVRYWDKAGTKGGDGARTAGVLKARAQSGLFYVVDVIAGRWGAVEREAIIKQTAALDQQRYGRVEAWVEQEPGSGGKESAESTVLNLAGYVVQIERVTGSKETRAEPLAIQAEAGNVRLVEGDWNPGFLDEIENFPKGALKDQVDAAGGAFNKLALVPPASGEVPQEPGDDWFEADRSVSPW